MKKKKFYLYLGLFGIALILGSFGIIINNSISGTYAANTETCVDSTSVCADGYSKVVLNGVTQCRKATNVSKVADCDGTIKTSYSCSTSGYDLIEYGGETYCGKEVSASKESACNEDWIDGKCYKLVNPTTTNVCYVYNDISYSCDAGYTLSSDKQSCCKTAYSDCDDASASDKATCRTCIDNGGNWNGDECIGASVAPTTCDELSGNAKTLCNNCVDSTGEWDYDDNTCDCKKEGYYYNSSTRMCTEIPECGEGEHLNDSYECVESDYAECNYESSDQNALCKKCIDNGNTWKNDTCFESLKSCSFSTDCDTSSGYYCSSDKVCVKATESTECNAVYGSGTYYDNCEYCKDSNGTWNFVNNSCSGLKACVSSNNCDDGFYCNYTEGVLGETKRCIKIIEKTPCDKIYNPLTDDNYTSCMSCKERNSTWDFVNNSCSDGCETGYHYNTNTSKCVADYGECNYENSVQNLLCTTCLDAENKWENNTCTESCKSGYHYNTNTSKCVADYADCNYESSDQNLLCTTCLDAENKWENNTCIKSCNISADCGTESGYYCSSDKVCVKATGSTSCNTAYKLGSYYDKACTSCRSNNNGTWDFTSDSCSCKNGYHYSTQEKKCVSDYAECNYESSDQNAVCTACIDAGNTWENDTCNTSSSTQKECSVKFNKCTNSDVESMCKEYGGRLSDDNTCIYETSGTCASSTYTCSSTTNIITNSSKDECTSLDCKLCVSKDGKYNVDTARCDCGTGKAYDNVKGCVEVKSDSSSSTSNTTDSTSTTSGYYYIKNGTCTEYPYLPGYCVEPGQLFYRSEIGGYTASNTATLSCVEVAAGYYGGSIISNEFFAAQELMNSREYYVDSDCKTSVTSLAGASTIESRAQQWCNTIPSFSGATIYLKSGESKTLTDSTSSLKDYSISGDSSIVSISTNSNIVTVKAIGSSGCETITMSKGKANSYTVYENPNSQNYATISALPLVKASFEVCITSEDEPVTVTDTYGGLKIVKNDADGNVLSGVKFKMGTNLYGTEGTDWSYKTTDSNGEIIVENIKTGTTYYYQEVSTIDGYVLDSNIYNVSIKKDEVISINVVNYKEGNATFKILKTDEGNKPLSGVKFKIGTNLAGKEGTDWSYMITDASGVITVGDIPINTIYYYQEVSTLDGYILNDEVKEVILDEENIIVIKGEVNYTNTSVTIIKKDADNGTLLKNVKFDIYDDEGNVVYSKMTDKNGEIVIQGIKNGKYYALEKEAADGYLLDNVKHSFEISDDNKHVVIEVTNKANNPQTGSFYIYTMLIVGSACLCISILQYKRIRNEDAKL